MTKEEKIKKLEAVLKDSSIEIIGKPSTLLDALSWYNRLRQREADMFIDGHEWYIGGEFEIVEYKGEINNKSNLLRDQPEGLISFLYKIIKQI